MPYYVAPEAPMMSPVIADCPDLAPPKIFDKSTPVPCIRTFSRKTGSGTNLRFGNAYCVLQGYPCKIHIKYTNKHNLGRKGVGTPLKSTNPLRNAMHQKLLLRQF